MEPTIAATPFGPSPFSLAHFAAYRSARERPADASANKWQLHHWVRIARARLGIGERALTLLHALISFYPGTVLAGTQLVVFPSNATLAIRANCMASSTLRRHLAALVDAGLVLRRDSPNGKRYARKNSRGELTIVFGFDLSPLLARASELERMAEEILAEEQELRLLRERISLHRRDIAKMIAVALDEGLPVSPNLLGAETAPGSHDTDQGWPAVHARFRALVDGIARGAPPADLAGVEADLSRFSSEIFNHLELHSKTTKMSTSAAQIEQHIQNSKPENSSDLEARDEETDNIRTEPPPPPLHGGAMQRCTYPLELVLEACPDIADYAPDGIVRDWRTLEAAAATVRPMLSISPDAFETACAVLGRPQAAITIAAILQRGEAIRSAGGYLRSLTARARAGTFSLSPVLNALVRKRCRAEDARRE